MSALRNRVAVITGSTRGLGRAIAEAYARAGASVIISSRHGKDVEQTVRALREKKLQAEGAVCDVSDPVQVEDLASTAKELYGFFDIWVNNAAVLGPVGPTMELPPADFRKICDTNMLGVYYGSRVALQHFLQRKRGKLINVIGLANDFKAEPLFNAYAASKAWTRTFTQSLAQEYKGKGIGIYAFQPSLLKTPLMTQLEVIAPYQKLLEPFKDLLTTWGQEPKAMLEMALWLATSATSQHTGLEVTHTKLSSTVVQTISHWFRKTFQRNASTPLVELQIQERESARNKPLHEEDAWEHYW